jgi:hypothetical protein
MWYTGKRIIIVISLRERQVAGTIRAPIALATDIFPIARLVVIKTAGQKAESAPFIRCRSFRARLSTMTSTQLAHDHQTMIVWQWHLKNKPGVGDASIQTTTARTPRGLCQTKFTTSFYIKSEICSNLCGEILRLFAFRKRSMYLFVTCINNPVCSSKASNDPASRVPQMLRFRYIDSKKTQNGATLGAFLLPYTFLSVYVMCDHYICRSLRHCTIPCSGKRILDTNPNKQSLRTGLPGLASVSRIRRTFALIMGCRGYQPSDQSHGQPTSPQVN